MYKYDITEYRNITIPQELRSLMGKISRDEMLNLIYQIQKTGRKYANK